MARGVLAKSVTKPAGTTMTKFVEPIWYLRSATSIESCPSPKGVNGTGRMGCWAIRSLMTMKLTTRHSQIPDATDLTVFLSIDWSIAVAHARPGEEDAKPDQPFTVSRPLHGRAPGRAQCLRTLVGTVEGPRSGGRYAAI